MFNWFKPKEKWCLVKSFTDSVTQSGKNGTVFLHLFESQTGKRKMESACSFSLVDISELDRYVNTSDLYQKKIYRWLNGRLDPEIPRYDQIPEEDVVNVLKGEI